METAYLAHHGVKGMKWGVRKDRTHGKRSRKTREHGPVDERKAIESHAQSFSMFQAPTPEAQEAFRSVYKRDPEVRKKHAAYWNLPQASWSDPESANKKIAAAADLGESVLKNYAGVKHDRHAQLTTGFGMVSTIYYDQRKGRG